MNKNKKLSSIGIVIVLMSMATVTYSACCYYIVSWQESGGACKGEEVMFCEEATPSCAEGSQQGGACLIKGNPRRRQCYTLRTSVTSNWYKGSCDEPPAIPGDWILIAWMPDGYCCWVSDADLDPFYPEETPVVFIDDCSGKCVSGGGGGA